MRQQAEPIDQSAATISSKVYSLVSPPGVEDLVALGRRHADREVVGAGLLAELAPDSGLPLAEAARREPVVAVADLDLGAGADLVLVAAAEITDQTPDTRVAWKSTSGAENAGAVVFESLAADRTHVTLKLDAEPEGPVETVGANVGVLERQVKGDLERFRDQIESAGEASGGWRGEIHGDEVDKKPEPRIAGATKDG